MDLAVGGKGFFGKDVVGCAVEIGDAAACFLHYQVAGSYVPWLQVVLPETVKAATGHPAKVYSSRAKAAHWQPFQHQALKYLYRVLCPIGPVVRKPGNQEGSIKISIGRYFYWFAIECSALAL